MKKYKIEFSGFSYVEAKNINEAIENFECGDTVYDETETGAVTVVKEFEVEMY